MVEDYKKEKEKLNYILPVAKLLSHGWGIPISDTGLYGPMI